MIITELVEDIRAYCDLLTIMSELNFVFYGEVVQDLICELHAQLPACKDFFAGAMQIKEKCPGKIALPSIHFVDGDTNDLFKPSICRKLNMQLAAVAKSGDMVCYKLWNGSIIVDLVYRENPVMFCDADNLVWSLNDGFGFLHEPQIERKSLFVPEEYEVFYLANELAKKCAVKITTIYDEIDVDICMNLRSRGWIIENLFQLIPYSAKHKSCLVCHGEFNKNEQIVTNCGKHSFHQICLMNWWRCSEAGVYYGCSVCKNEIVITNNMEHINNCDVIIAAEVVVDLP